MRLQEAEILKLLPAWMREDPAVQGLAAGTDKLTQSIYSKIKLLSRWDQIDSLSDAELDEMAWELNIQWYESTAPIETKRKVIRNSDIVYSKLGTSYAVEQLVTDYFGSGQVREWFEYGGKPHHFKVLSANPELVNNNLELFLKLLSIVKRRSALLDAILICLTGEMYLYTGMAVRDHNAELHIMGTNDIQNYYGSDIDDRGNVLVFGSGFSANIDESGNVTVLGLASTIDNDGNMVVTKP